MINKNVDIDRNENWFKLLSSMSSGSKFFWRITKIITGKYSKNIGKISEDGKDLFTNEESNCYCKQFL